MDVFNAPVIRTYICMYVRIFVPTVPECSCLMLFAIMCCWPPLLSHIRRHVGAIFDWV